MTWRPHKLPIFLFCLLLFAGSVSLIAQMPEDETAAEPQDKPVDDSKDKKEKKQKKSKKERKAQLEQLSPEYRQWLESVDMLITKEEKDFFLDLVKDYQRDAFIERFWKARDPYPQTSRNEARERHEAKVEEVMSRYGNLSEDRAIILLFNDSPDVVIPIRCVELWPAEVWYWEKNKKTGQTTAILFVQRGGAGYYRIWYPYEGLGDLSRYPADNSGRNIEACGQQASEAIYAVLKFIQQMGEMGFSSLVNEMYTAPRGPTGEWVATFHAYSTELDEGAGTFPAWLEIEYPGRHQSRTVMQAIISVPAAELTVSQLADYGQTYNIMITGEVLRDQKLFDSFRYQYNFPVEQITTEKIPLVLERYLRPGDYTLILKGEDLNSGEGHRELVQISVPEVEHNTPTEPSDPETARILAEANAAISTGDSTIKIVPPRGRYQTGMMRVDTLTTGKEIVEVVFDLDGKQTLVKHSPPWSVELDLGSLPRMRTLTVVGLDSGGNEVARDEAHLNSGSHRFDVRLIEPRRGRKYSRSLRAEVLIDVPEGSVVDRVEYYLNETLVATLYQPPWTQPILLNTEGELAYVRAVAYQPDGNFIEDTVWVNAPDYMENMEIQFVELFITVLDKHKHPVQGLEIEDFQVFEDGLEQEPRRFDVVSNLPIHAGILLDVSASMEERLRLAQRAALTFLEEGVTPKDRATIITFNDHPNLAVKFTNDLPTLAGGLAGLKAERGTALYDSLIFSLYYFNGIKGQRALILLSDGKDEHSRFDWEDTREYARRAGVSIYSIGLDLGHKNRDAKKKLVKLAEQTGGRSFFVEDPNELSDIYKTILEDLRSRYFLAYQSTNTADDTAFRTVEVKLKRSGLEAKTLRGYYP